MKMARIYWRLTNISRCVKNYLKKRWNYFRITVYSLFYNHFLNWSYVCDILMEPILWFVENFTAVLGPIFVVMVTFLTILIVIIAYWIGLPYWWEKSPAATVILFIVGNWLLVNVAFHYYMGVNVPAGYPPLGNLIPEAVSICKKCITPKPPRTHHCSVCDKCIMKMDHHCPWLNNCVGHYNHRYFLQYMVFTVVGVLFIMVFGVEIAYQEFFPDQDPELNGHPVRINNSQIIPVTESMDHLSAEEIAEIERQVQESEVKDLKRKVMIFTALISVATFAALGALTWWHIGLISQGETSIEARINRKEAQRHKEMGRVYQNPYNFGSRENWRLFLGLKNGRTWWRILFPSTHKPLSDGLTWQTIHDIQGSFNYT